MPLLFICFSFLRFLSLPRSPGTHALSASQLVSAGALFSHCSFSHHFRLAGNLFRCRGGIWHSVPRAAENRCETARKPSSVGDGGCSSYFFTKKNVSLWLFYSRIIFVFISHFFRCLSLFFHVELWQLTHSPCQYFFPPKHFSSANN